MPDHHLRASGSCCGRTLRGGCRSGPELASGCSQQEEPGWAQLIRSMRTSLPDAPEIEGCRRCELQPEGWVRRSGRAGEDDTLDCSAILTDEQVFLPVLGGGVIGGARGGGVGVGEVGVQQIWRTRTALPTNQQSATGREPAART